MEKIRSEVVDMDHEAFGDYVSDDESFEPVAHYVRVKSAGEVGVFVGDGKDIVMCATITEEDGSNPLYGQPFVLTDKEASRLGHLLIKQAKQAKRTRKAQEEHRASLPMKKTKGK